MSADRVKPEDFAEAFRLKAVAYAKAEGDALRAEKKAKRIFSQLVIEGDGAVSHREHAARVAQDFVTADDFQLQLQTEANILKAELESMRISFEVWRTTSANKRQEMKL